MTNTKIIKSNKYSLTEMNPILMRICVLWHFCVVFRPYGNRLRWSLYRAGITPLRGLYACYTGNLCTLVIYGNIVCICTSYVGLRRKWPYVGEKVPYVRKKETVPFSVPFLFRHKGPSIRRKSKFFATTQKSGHMDRCYIQVQLVLHGLSTEIIRSQIILLTYSNNSKPVRLKFQCPYYDPGVQHFGRLQKQQRFMISF